MTSIAERWAARELESEYREKISPMPLVLPFRHYKPFVDAVNTYVAEARDGERIMFGIPEFDQQIRGIGKSQLCNIVGYNTSGKTLLLAHILRHNRDKRVAFFTPDEPAQLVLAKLASVHFGVPADEIEDRVINGDSEAVELLRRTALEAYPNLAVFDGPLRGEDMDAALGEAETVWGGSAECVVVDYLELLQAGDTVPAKFEFIKAFGSGHELPVILVHQTSRTAGKDGAAQTISSGNFGGETFATFQLGVWRKKSAIAAALVELRDKIARSTNITAAMIDQREELEHELERAQYTVTVAITKNKRPGRREGREEIDFELYGDTGLLVPLADGDLPRQYMEKLAGRRTQAGEWVQAPGSYELPKSVEQQIITDDQFYDEEPW